MAETQEIRVPDIGDFDAVDVIEVLVSPGDRVAEEDGLITLESEKASMDVPSPKAGTVKEVKVSAGDQVSEGDVIVLLEVGAEPSDAPEEAADSAEGMKRPVPDRGGAPAGEGDVEEEEAEEAPEEVAEAEKRVKRPSSASAGEGGGEAEEDKDREPALRPLDEPVDEEAFGRVYASPSIRRFARELGVDLSKVEGTGRNGRILREDVQEYVKRRLAERGRPAAGAPSTPGLVDLPEIDFSKWGEVETEELSKVQRLTGRNVHRAWVTIPHVTQHDEADVTELEAFRKSLKEEAQQRGVKLTPIPFLIRAVVAALKEYPRFNSSLAPDAESIVVKRYFHVGVAVDTEAGLVVPVVKDADRKGLFELAAEVGDLARRARERKLKSDEMEGGTFTISSLGGIGGTAFTPIVNWPEVAILGVSRAQWRVEWRPGDGDEEEGELEPRLMMPLSLSYDHRVIDGARAVRFTRYLARVLEDLRRLLL